MRFPRTLALLLLPFACGCTTHLRSIQEPGRSVAFTTTYPFNSMIYAARTDSGVVVVDLGWTGAERRLEKELRGIGARPEDVTDVFLTHSHRDHIAAWRAVRGARFHLVSAELPLFAGADSHADPLSRASERVFGSAAPGPGEVAAVPFASDTVFTFGRDTVRAFVLPGHTAGSAAYLIRGVLFAGDAVAYSYLRGFRTAFRIYSHDTEQNRRSVESLWQRSAPYDVRWVCTAHGKCANPDSAFLSKLRG